MQSIHFYFPNSYLQPCWHLWDFFFFLVLVGIEFRAFNLARQVLYHLSHALVLLLLVHFTNKSPICFRLASDQDPPPNYLGL
jgi:1-acyl-sn-glycerol-3-phosphate acyltransferase